MISEKKDLDMQSNNKPFVAIYMITYNHESYIEQAVESIMIQQTNFEYKLFIGEDCSTDKTVEICKSLKGKYPNKIDLFLNANNLGATLNAQQIFKACFESGAKYIALLEGDDYWTDPLQLQQQVNFLEANPEYVLTHHDASVIDVNGNHLKDSKLAPDIKQDFDEIGLQRGVSLATLTLCFRNVFINKSIDLPNVVNGDMALISILGLYGKGKYMENIQNACYRVHSGGIWSQTSRIKQNIAKYGTFEEMSRYFFRLGYNDLGVYYRKKLKQQYRVLFLFHIRNKNFKEAIKYWKKYNLFYIKNNFTYRSLIEN